MPSWISRAGHSLQVAEFMCEEGRVKDKLCKQALLCCAPHAYNGLTLLMCDILVNVSYLLCERIDPANVAAHIPNRDEFRDKMANVIDIHVVPL